jgi:hypothetical protein
MPFATGVVQLAGVPAAIDLDQAQAARAEGLDVVGGAQLGDRAKFASTFLPAIIWSRVSTPRVLPKRHGVHLPQLSTAQNSIAKRAMLRHVGAIVKHRNTGVADQASAAAKAS